MSFWGAIGSAASSYAQSDNFYSDIFDGILGGLEANAAAKQGKKANKFALKGIQATGVEARKTAEFQTLLEKWLKDKDKEERRSGLSNYNKFSSVKYGEPAYRAPAVGNMPTARSFESAFGAPPTQQPPNSLAGAARGLTSEYDFSPNYMGGPNGG